MRYPAIAVYVGVLQLTVLVPDSHSLKEKRAVLGRVKGRVRERFGVALTEVGGQDTWQRAELGAALVGSDAAYVERALDDLTAAVAAEVAVTARWRDVVHYPARDRMGDDWTTAAGGSARDEELARAARAGGTGDKAAAVAALGGDDWVPAAWRDDGSDDDHGPGQPRRGDKP
ncbi:MAG: DUF503 domain-containing protein [Kofleriaceae bacterium]|nr:DUF503 domain-containing protein [Kofleriaceae bacterium]